MPLEQTSPDVIASVLNSISAFSSATSIDMTTAPRNKIGELLTFLLDSIPNENANVEFINCINQFNTIYKEKFSEEAFLKYYNTAPVEITFTALVPEADVEKARTVIGENLKKLNKDKLSKDQPDWESVHFSSRREPSDLFKVTAILRTRLTSTEFESLQKTGSPFLPDFLQASYSPTHFRPNLNQGLGELITQLLYTIRLHLDCIERFDQHNTNKNIQAILYKALDDHVAPLVCSDVYYYDDFVDAFKKSSPRIWQDVKTMKSSGLGKEVIYYCDFAFECSGSSDPQSKLKLFDRKKRSSFKKTVNPPSKNTNSIDFLAHLLKFTAFQDRAGHYLNEEGKLLAHAELCKLDEKNFGSIVITSHDQILMDLQSFLWTHYNVSAKGNDGNLGKHIEQFTSKTFNKLYQDLMTQGIPLFASKAIKQNIENSFKQLKNKLSGHGQDMIAILHDLIDAQSETKYSRHVNFAHVIESTIWFVMQFWFYYDDIIKLEQLIDLFEKVPKSYEIHRQLGDFILKNIQQSTRPIAIHHKHLFALNLIRAEEKTKTINPKLTPYLQSLLLEQASSSKTSFVIEDESPDILRNRRNAFILTKSKEEQNQHLIMTIDLMWEMITHKLYSAHFLTKLYYRGFEDSRDKITERWREGNRNDLGDQFRINQLVNALTTLGDNAKWGMVSNPLHTELLLLVAQTLIETKQYKKYSDGILAKILSRMPANSPITNLLIDELWTRNDNPTSLSSNDQYEVLLAILNNKTAQKKYYSHIDKLYDVVSKTCVSVLNNKKNRDDLADLHITAKANPPSMIPQLSLWSRIKSAIHRFRIKRTPQFDIEESTLVSIHDHELVKFCKKPLSVHKAEFYKHKISSINSVTPQIGRHHDFYTQLRVELTQFLATQQYLAEMEEYNGVRYPRGTTVHIANAQNPQTYIKNENWMKCIQQMPMPRDAKDLERRKLRVKGQPYQRASLIAEALAQQVTIALKDYLSSLKDIPLMDEVKNVIIGIKTETKHIVPAAASICFNGFTLQNAEPPADECTFEMWTKLVANEILAKTIDAQKGAIAKNCIRAQNVDPSVELLLTAQRIANHINFRLPAPIQDSSFNGNNLSRANVPTTVSGSDLSLFRNSEQLSRAQSRAPKEALSSSTRVSAPDSSFFRNNEQLPRASSRAPVAPKPVVANDTQDGAGSSHSHRAI